MKIFAGPGGPVQWGRPLPPKFAPEKNERCLELPLALLAVYRVSPILDAGCSLNKDDTHDWLRAHVVHINLSGEQAYRHPRRHYVTGDLRALPFADRSFPAVACVSTLEHVGMDNRHYRGGFETDPESMWAAVAELRRVTSDTLVISVPYGIAEPHPSGQWRACGPGDLGRLLTMLQPATTSVAYYGWEPEGWRGAGPELGKRRAWRGEKTVTGLAVIKALVA